jgi:uncharacterized alpha-E superfamily protein
MLSRVAESIYWMQRYRERAENIARFIEVNLYLSLDVPHERDAQWLPLVQTSGDEDVFRERYGGQADEHNVTEFLTFDVQNPNSILNCLYNARENAKTVREVITSEMWQEINTTYLFVRRAAEDRKLIRSHYEFYNRIKRQCQLFNGIADSAMSRNEAWHFGHLGMLLERADKTSRILDVKYFMLLPSAEYVGTPYDNIQWCALLKSASALEMYRKLWHQVYHVHVVDFLVLNRDFPRAILCCLAGAEESLHAISGIPMDKFSNEPERGLARLRVELASREAPEIIQKGLHEFLNELQLKIMDINDSIFTTFFARYPVGAKGQN